MTLYISFHLQVDPLPGVPCLVYLLHNKLNTLDPLPVSCITSCSACVPLHFPPDHSCPYTTLSLLLAGAAVILVLIVIVIVVGSVVRNPPLTF